MSTQTSPTHPSRQRLLHRIHARYQTITQRMQFGELTFEFTRIAQPDRVLDDIIAIEDAREKSTGVRLADPPHLPYWAELWESSSAIAGALAAMDLNGKRVLDLGCGMGLAGTAAAAGGADVLLADLESPALLLARLNSWPFASRVRARCLNWQIDRLEERFDLILGADIIYEKKQWEYLDEFWRAHLSPRGSILIAEPGRASGDQFIPWIIARGWQLTQSEQAPTVSRGKAIRIIQLRQRVISAEPLNHSNEIAMPAR